MWELAGCPELHVFKDIDGSSCQMPFADGGGVDNLAVHAALRRGVEKLLVCVACSGDYATVVLAPNGEEELAKKIWDLSGLFGAVPEGKADIKMGGGKIEDHVWNKHLQVFEKNEWERLSKQLASSAKAGGPLSARVKLKVLPNEVQGVTGNYDADVLFLLNSKCQAWEKELPAEGAKWINENDVNFPLIATDKLDYDAALTGYLSSLAAFNMLQIQEDVADLIGLGR